MENETLQLSESITLGIVDCVKLLGIDIDKKLTFSSHIARICKKAGKHSDCYVLMRLLTSESKLMLFKYNILAHFNFCSTVWHFVICQTSEKGKKSGTLIAYCLQ